MKIISDFNDYYDHAVHPSQIDPNIRYIRQMSISNDPFTGTLPVDIGIPFYYTYDVHKEDKSKSSFNCTVNSALLTIGRRCFNIVVDSDLNGYGSVELYEKFIIKRHLNSNDGPYEPSKGEVRKLTLHTYYDGGFMNKKVPVLKNIDDYDATDLNFKYGIPVNLFYEVNRKIFVCHNPSLKNLNMMSIIDVYQTWQEISMWIGGIMPGQQSPMVELSDMSKIEKQGFDKVYGFRNRPKGKHV